MATNEKVMIGIPTHNGTICDGMIGGIVRANYPDLAVTCRTSSLLANNFNCLMLDAMNLGFDRLIILHADIEIEEFDWINKMIELCKTHRLSVLSAHVPIKNDSGDASTAVLTAKNEVERIPMNRLFQDRQLPETFTVDNMAHGETLLSNTGLMMIRLKDIDPVRHHFTITDEITKGSNGKLQARNMPEDWNFSMELHRSAIRYGVTSEIKLKHVGSWSWGS